jgi:hypothetical protein
MQWNLHIVGQALETELEDLLQKLVVDLEGIGHQLTSATLTTDTGQRSLATTPLEEPAQTVGGEPVVDTTAPPADASGTSDSSTSDSSSEVPTDTPPSL